MVFTTVTKEGIEDKLKRLPPRGDAYSQGYIAGMRCVRDAIDEKL